MALSEGGAVAGLAAPDSQGVFDPGQWYTHLLRLYLAGEEETVLGDIADLGRLMAVMAVPLEVVVESHGLVHAEAVAAGSEAHREQMTALASTCLSELMVAWRIAAEGLGGWGGAEGSPGRDQLPPFRRFDGDGRFITTAWNPELIPNADAADIMALIGLLAGPERAEAVRRAVAQRRLHVVEFNVAATDRSYRAIICPFRDGSGVLGLRDTTEAEQQRKQVLQKSKFEALGRMAGGISHEFNNLLQPIISVAQMAMEDRADDPELIGEFQIVLDCAMDAAKIVRGILTFARPPDSGMATVQLDQVVAGHMDALRGRVPPRVEITSRLEPGQTVAADRAEVGELLLNLVTNAADAMEGGGRIVITVSGQRIADSESVRRGLPEGRYARLSVGDSGSGIAAVNLGRVFDPFFSTKDIGKGTGLGLSIVQGIVRSWGGGIFVANQPAGGALFDIFIPLVESAEPAIAVAGAKMFQVAARRRIMVVEDEPRVREGWVRALVQAGQTVSAHASGVEALAELAGASWDVLVTDLSMPGMDGVTLIAQVRARHPGIRIIAVTGDWHRDQPATLKAGADRLLFKPVSLDVFLQEVLPPDTAI